MELLRKNRAFFIFLAKFGLTYLALSGIYALYLSQFDAARNEPDGITGIVAYQTQDLLVFFGEDAFTRPRKYENSYKFFIGDIAVARIVEGCNGISVMILFVSFIVAFSSTIKKTMLYIGVGLITLHVLNIVRIALLCVSFYYYPQYSEVAHDVFFPLFIYGVVFVLWIFWVVKFSGYGKKTKA
jgi:exosortase family protein XrtF